MLTNLLWLWDAKLQYERQKAQGLAGLLALLGVIFVVWKWHEWFYPFFNKIGLVGLAERTGLVSDLSIITVVNVVAIIFIICLFVALISFSVVAIGFLFLMFGASTFGQHVITFALLPVMLPFLVFYTKKARESTLIGHYQRDKELRPLLKKYKGLDIENKKLHLYLEQLHREDETFQLEKWSWLNKEPQRYLNRVIPSVKANSNFLIGYHPYHKKTYLFFPNPLPETVSRSFEHDTYKKGSFGFESQLLQASIGIESSRSFYVPALETSFEWDGEKLCLDVDPSSPIEAVNLILPYEFYFIESSEFKKEVQQITLSRTDLHEILHRAHVSFYLFPIVFKHLDDETIRPAWEKFFMDSLNVTNADVLKPVYQADVEKEIIESAKHGESWAIKWFEKVE